MQVSNYLRYARWAKGGRISSIRYRVNTPDTKEVKEDKEEEKNIYTAEEIKIAEEKLKHVEIRKMKRRTWKRK